MKNNLVSKIYNYSPIFLQNLFCSIVGYQYKKYRFGKKFEEMLKFLEKSQWWEESDFNNYQDEKLKELIKHAYKTTPYYQELFNSLKLLPKDFKRREHLNKLPILEKQFVKDNYDKFVSRAFSKFNLVKKYTSGTTGSGLKIYYTKDALQLENAFVWRQRRLFGADINDSYATFNGNLIVPFKQIKPPFWRKNYISKQTLFSIFHLKSENLRYYVDYLNSASLKYYVGYPSALYLIASYIKDINFEFLNSPKAIFTSSETLFSNQRDIIQKAFKTKIADRYGNVEMASAIIECEKGNYHLDMEYGIFELDETEKLSNGDKRGFLICTGFINYAMPLIRYKINDIITISNQKCDCGRNSIVVKQIDGRIEDFIVLPDGRKIGRLDHIFKQMYNIKESQIIQEKSDELVIKIVKRPNYSLNDEKDLIKAFQERVGVDVKLYFDYVNEIPREKNGKFRAVISKVK